MYSEKIEKLRYIKSICRVSLFSHSIHVIHFELFQFSSSLKQQRKYPGLDTKQDNVLY